MVGLCSLDLCCADVARIPFPSWFGASVSIGSHFLARIRALLRCSRDVQRNLVESDLRRALKGVLDLVDLFFFSVVIPEQRRMVDVTSVRLEFGPDISLECPHAPSPSVTKKQLGSKSMKATCTKARFSTSVRFLSMFCVAPRLAAPRTVADEARFFRIVGPTATTLTAFTHPRSVEYLRARKKQIQFISDDRWQMDSRTIKQS
jgi:hypothetical protein